MKLADLKDGQVVRARWSRADDWGPSEWCPWQDIILHVKRVSEAKYPVHRRRPVSPGGIDCLTFTTADGAPVIWLTERDAADDESPRESYPWSEYEEGDFFEGFFYSDDCYLEIEGLTE